MCGASSLRHSSGDEEPDAETQSNNLAQNRLQRGGKPGTEKHSVYFQNKKKAPSLRLIIFHGATPATTAADFI